MSQKKKGSVAPNQPLRPTASKISTSPDVPVAKTARVINTEDLVFGKETKGLPRDIIDEWPQRLFNLPMRSPHIRSLNLANTVTAAAFQALRGQYSSE